MATKILNIQDYTSYIKCGEILKSPLPNYQHPFVLKCYECDKINFMLESFIIHIQEHCNESSVSQQNIKIASENEVESEPIENPIVKIETFNMEVDDPLVVIKDEQELQIKTEIEEIGTNNLDESDDQEEDKANNTDEEEDNPWNSDDTEDDERTATSPKPLEKTQNKIFAPGEFQDTPVKDLTNKENVNVPPSNRHESLLLDLCDEIKSLKFKISNMHKDVKELKSGNKKSFTKLTEEVIALKYENRKHHGISIDDYKDVQKLPLTAMEDLEQFDDELQQNEEKLRQFKEFIAKTGGEGHAQFMRAAVRKVFSDQLACLYSWKGTISKPSAEKCFLIKTIKNICHGKYNCTDKDIDVVLQKHFVHAKDRVMKRKRPN